MAGLNLHFMVHSTCIFYQIIVERGPLYSDSPDCFFFIRLSHEMSGYQQHLCRLPSRMNHRSTCSWKACVLLSDTQTYTHGMKILECLSEILYDIRAASGCRLWTAELYVVGGTNQIVVSDDKIKPDAGGGSIHFSLGYLLHIYKRVSVG